MDDNNEITDPGAAAPAMDGSVPVGASGDQQQGAESGMGASVGHGLEQPVPKVYTDEQWAMLMPEVKASVIRSHMAMKEAMTFEPADMPVQAAPGQTFRYLRRASDVRRSWFCCRDSRHPSLHGFDENAPKFLFGTGIWRITRKICIVEDLSTMPVIERARVEGKELCVYVPARDIFIHPDGREDRRPPFACDNERMFDMFVTSCWYYGLDGSVYVKYRRIRKAYEQLCTCWHPQAEMLRVAIAASWQCACGEMQANQRYFLFHTDFLFTGRFSVNAVMRQGERRKGIAGIKATGPAMRSDGASIGSGGAISEGNAAAGSDV